MSSSTASATQRAYDFIRQRLQSREVEPGTRLVTRSLARELGTSLNPVREALNRLSSQGLVDHVPGAGTFVHRPDPQSIRELYEVREAIEGFAVTEAVDHITDEQLAVLERLCAEWRDQHARMVHNGIERLDGEELGAWATKEELFHRTLVDATCNRMLQRIVEHQGILAKMFASLNAIDHQVTTDIVGQVAASHGELVAAIKAGDKAAARERITALLRQGLAKVPDPES